MSRKNELCKSFECTREAIDGYCSMHKFNVSGVRYQDFLDLQSFVHNCQSETMEAIELLEKLNFTDKRIRNFLIEAKTESVMAVLFVVGDVVRDVLAKLTAWTQEAKKWK